MAARLNAMHTEAVRARIKLGLLQKRLEDNSLGKIEMSSGQIETSKFLVNKAMGDPPKIVSGPNPDGSHKVEMTLSFK